MSDISDSVLRRSKLECWPLSLRTKPCCIMRAADKHGKGVKSFITGYSKPGSGLTALFHDLLYCLTSCSKMKMMRFLAPIL